MIRSVFLSTLVLLAVLARSAHAQPKPETPKPETIDWKEFEITGKLIDDPAKLRRIFAPELRSRTSLGEQERKDIAEFAAQVGYHLVDTARGPARGGGTKLILVLDPIPVVRWVDVRMKQGIVDAFLSNAVLDDEVRRRLRVRVGTPLPWDLASRQVLLDEDSERIRRFLRDEGYFEATVIIALKPTKKYGVQALVNATLGPKYQLGRVEVINASSGGTDLAIPAREVARSFKRGSRFTYQRFLEDIDKITVMFQRRGYPSVRVIHDFDPLTSFDRRTHKVDVRVSIDPRRKLDVVFEGNDKSAFPDDELTRQLTFASSGTADDVEVAASARAIERYYQSKGYFDVMVTSERVRLGAFDRVVYRIEPGLVRETKNVTIVCRKYTESGDRPLGECALPKGELEGAIGARSTTRRLLGGTLFLSSAQLTADVAALDRYYQSRGFQEAKTTVEVAPTTAGWIAAAVTAAQVLAEHKPQQLQVRFVVDEGPRTTIASLHVVFEGRAAGRANAADEKLIIERTKLEPGDPYVQQKLADAAKDLADWYWSFGRPRARVSVLPPTPGARAGTVDVTFNIEERQELKIGEVIVRGNFRTKEWVILDELGFQTGAPLTGDLFTAGPRRLRATNLFDAVKLDFVGFDDSHRDTVNVVVRTEERHDYRWGLDLEGGWSSENSIFVRGKPSVPNLWGWGIRADGSLTVGAEYQAFEGTIRAPRWIPHHNTPLSFDSELAGFLRRQKTERFGQLETRGVSYAASRTWERQRTDEHGGRLFTVAARYDWRRRQRDEELVRPPGLAGDITTNPIITKTGTVGLTLTWDQRRDARGNLNPLAPDNGFRLEAGVAYSRPGILFSQDTFAKLNGLGQIFATTGRLQLRLDGRYDHGIPLDGAVLLPEVERYFAGGDSTVRGFEEDRLATEIIEASVPPIGQTTQIRVLPAGGNIRALATADAQVTVWKVGGFPVASALFIDAGLITNTWSTVEIDDVRPAVGTAVRVLLPIGAISLEYAVPLVPHVGDDPRGRYHFAVALRY